MPDTAPVESSGPRQPRIAIVGGGLSGIIGGAMLKQNGLDNFVIYEKFDEFGGTWYQNHYPGLACDVPAYLYQCSFEPNPYWSAPYPPRDELLQYCIDLADKYNLRKHAKFSTDVFEYRWNDDRSTWTLKTAQSDGLELNLGPPNPDEEFDIVLNYRKAFFFPHVPNIPGAKDGTFNGESWHSMDWVDGGMKKLKGKRVAVIGLAAAAVQIIPNVAKHCEKLYVYPRTPNWVHPRPNAPWSQEQKEAWAKDPVAYRLWCSQRGTEFYGAWEGTMLHPGSDIAKKEEELCKNHLFNAIKDPKLREVFLPTYAPWARRMCYSDEFYPSLVQPHVEVAFEKLVRIEKDGIVSSTQSPLLGVNSGVGVTFDVRDDPNAVEKKREVDIIIWATGFDFGHAQPPLFGKGGVSAGEIMARDGEPKLYMAPISFFKNIETNMAWALLLIRKMIDENLASFETTPEAIDRYDKLMDETSKGTAFGVDCPNSYYKFYRADGTFKCPVFFPGPSAHMERLFSSLVEEDFEFIPNRGDNNKWCYGDRKAIAEELKKSRAAVKFGGVYKGPSANAHSVE